MSARELDSFEVEILSALVEGFAARADMKERLQALSEWEIARRSSYTQASYAEYARHPAREKLTRALGTLEGAGLIAVWARGALYDSFVPTEAGIWSAEAKVLSARSAGVSPAATDGGSFTGGQDVRAPGPSDPSAVVERLDEVIRLLRSIDARLAALERSDRGS